MEKYETISINSCNFDGIVEEFNKQDLQEAGVFIDYDHNNEINGNPDKSNKNNSNHSKWIKLIFLGVLMILLVIVMCVGYILMNKQESTLDVNQSSIQAIELSKSDFF